MLLCFLRPITTQMAEADQKAAAANFLAWASRYVPDAASMNIASGLQIRALIFPDGQLNGGVRAFKAPNPEYDAWTPGSGGKRPRRYRDLELWGLWGRGQPGRIPPEAFTAKGAAAVSQVVLRTLSGRVGAARKALAALRAGEAEAAAAAAAASASSAGGPPPLIFPAVPILGDELEDLMEEAAGEGEDGGEGEVAVDADTVPASASNGVASDGAVAADGEAAGEAARSAVGLPTVRELNEPEFKALQEARRMLCFSFKL